MWNNDGGIKGPNKMTLWHDLNKWAENHINDRVNKCLTNLLYNVQNVYIYDKWKEDKCVTARGNIIH